MIGGELSCINKATNSVIHQKGMLIKNHKIKLRPLLLAIVAGHRATTINKKAINKYHIVVTVYPIIVIANIILPPLVVIQIVPLALGNVYDVDHTSG